MTLPVVVDASAGVEIALRTTDGQRLVAHVRGRMPHVPDVFYVEAAAALRRMENRGLLTATAASMDVHKHATFPVVFECKAGKWAGGIVDRDGSAGMDWRGRRTSGCDACDL